MELGMKSATSSMESALFEDDLSNWELVDASDLDLPEGIEFAYDSDLDLLVEAFSSDDSFDAEGEEPVGESDDDGEIEEQHEDECDTDEDEDNEVDEDDDLDDELVPRSVSDRFGRERMRKLGKRVSAKMAKSKRSPYLYTRPGCVHGKHGLGLKYKF